MKRPSSATGKSSCAKRRDNGFAAGADGEGKAWSISVFSAEASIRRTSVISGRRSAPRGKTVHTRFPPEPNGYLHIGHCKALIIDFGTAEKYGGLCNLRMDDTNPTKEDAEYVEAIQDDIHWLGFDWGDRFFFGSDYFEKDYEYAVELIKKGLAYVCELTPELCSPAGSGGRGPHNPGDRDGCIRRQI